MKIQKKYIGAKVWHSVLNKYFLIEVGKEDLYLRLGFDIFVKPRKPKLVKKDAKTTKRRSNNVRNNGNGTNNDK